jgi:hypothetical protein
MAERLQDLAGRFRAAGGPGGAGPRGLGLGIKLLAGAVAGAVGLQQSMYTGKS